MEGSGLPSGYGLYLLQTILALAAVCLLAFVGLRFLASRSRGLGGRGKAIRVIERVALDQRRSLVLVEVAGRTLLLGVSDGGVSLVAELDPGALSSGDKASDEVRTTTADRSPRPG